MSLDKIENNFAKIFSACKKKVKRSKRGCEVSRKITCDCDTVGLFTNRTHTSHTCISCGVFSCFISDWLSVNMKKAHQEQPFTALKLPIFKCSAVLLHFLWLARPSICLSLYPSHWQFVGRQLLHFVLCIKHFNEKSATRRFACSSRVCWVLSRFFAFNLQSTNRRVRSIEETVNCP